MVGSGSFAGQLSKESQLHIDSQSASEPYCPLPSPGSSHPVGVQLNEFCGVQQSHTMSGSPQLAPDGLKLVNPLFS